MGDFQGTAGGTGGWRLACVFAALLLLAGTLIVPVDEVEQRGDAFAHADDVELVTTTTFHGAWEYLDAYLEAPAESYMALLGAAWALLTALVACMAAVLARRSGPSAWLLILALVVLLVLGAAHAIRETTGWGRLLAGMPPKVTGPKAATVMALAAAAIAAASVVGRRHGASRWLALGGGLVLVLGLLTSATMRGLPPGAPADIGSEVLLREHILFDQVFRFESWTHAWANNLTACGFLVLGLVGLLLATPLGARAGLRRVGLALAWLLFLGIPVLSWVQVQQLVHSHEIATLLLGTTITPGAVARAFVLQGGYLLAAVVGLVGVLRAVRDAEPL